LNIKILTYLFLIFAILTIFPVNFVSGQEKRIVINEIAWMGTEEQWQNEWIELYNPTDSPISLDKWILKAKDDSPKIELSGKIGARSYFLLERTDDTTVPEISAHQIYKGGLNNQGEHLILLNNLGEIVDETDCLLGWFNGSNETKKTMERIDSILFESDSNNWKTSQKTGGTPAQENSPKTKITKEKNIKTVSTVSNGSGFSFLLIIGLVVSSFASMLIFAIWLKIKQKKDKIKIH
jgi:hypothetical protein